MKFVQINNIPALVQIMAWCQPGDKPLSEPMMIKLLTQICVTWPHWVNALRYFSPGRQATICTLNRNHYFLRAGTTSRTGGFFLGVLTLSACLTACTNNMTCQHVLWDFQNGRTCHGFRWEFVCSPITCCRASRAFGASKLDSMLAD